jgi:cytochrome c biogenesis protein CcmG, thiol:disulfide interchange protein DsbE
VGTTLRTALRRLLAPLPIAVICGVLALFALLGYGLASNEPDAGIEESLARGEREPAPALRLPRLSGPGQVELADYRGKVVVLNFWASWCEPCRAESPLLQRWHDRISRRGGTVLGVDVLDVSSDARKFVREYRLTYPMLRDRDGDSQADFGVVAYPETVVIDTQGRIAAIERGPVDERWLRRNVDSLLPGRT